MLTISVILSIYLAYGVFTQRYDLEQRLLSKANALGEFVAIVSPEAIYGFDITTLDQYVTQIMKDPEVFYATIVDLNDKQITTVMPPSDYPYMATDDIKKLTDWSESKPNIDIISYPIEPLDHYLGKVIVVLDTGVMQETYTKNIIRNIMIGLCGITLLSLIIAFIFRRSVIKPINELQEGAKRVATGNFVQPVKVLSLDELGELTVAFNKMMSEILEDRAELIEGTKKLRLLSWAVEQSPASVVITDTDGVIEYVNKTFVYTTGYAFDEVIGQKPNMLRSGKMPSAIYEELWNTIIKGDVWKGELLNKKRNGDLFWEDVSIRSIADEKGEIVNYLALKLDITEHKLKDEQLRHTQKMDALGKLTGGVAHDFNNILGIILGYSELLQMKLKSQPDLLKYIDQVNDAGERARKLTSRLLAFSRTQPVSADFIDINTLLIDDKSLLEKTLTARIKLELDLCENIWPVYIDKSGLQDAILNISINSLHAMPDGGRLSLTTSNQHLDQKEAMQLNIKPGDYILLSITDNGVGIDQDVLDKIFDPFFTTKGNAGTGLGLSQVYGYVQQSTGAIDVNSEPGQGTCITIYLPRSRDTSHSKLKDGSDQISSSIEGHEKILIVDDEFALRELTSEILSSHGYKVKLCEDAHQALSFLESNSVDLILSDVIMPGTDGFQLAMEVRKKYPDVKIQMVSGFSEDFQASNDNRDLYENRIHKPFTSEVLLKSIRDLLDS